MSEELESTLSEEPEPTVNEELESKKDTAQDRWLLLFSVLVLASLALHAFTFYTLIQVRKQAAGAVAQARAGLSTLAGEPIVAVVQIDQELPFSTTLPLDQSFQVPIDTVYPISTVVETAINIPLLGPQKIAVPIKTRFPIQLTIDVPVKMQVPISFTYHLDTEVPVEVAIPTELLTPVDAMLKQAEEGLQ